MTFQVADAHAHVQRLVSVVKMATVLEDQRTAFRYECFLWTQGLNGKDIHKEIFPVYDGKCLSRKTVHNWVEKFSPGRSKVADDARGGAEVAERTTVERLLCCGFRRTGKAMGQVYQCCVEDMSEK
jgi:hypothetical protein